MFNKLLVVNQIQRNIFREFGQHNKKHIYKDGVSIGGVVYYPRQPDYVEANVKNPPKLFKVQRIKPMRGAPFWEKRILNDLGLGNFDEAVAIVKNIPENNARLWKVKHLISVHPIVFPHGEPTENDVKHTLLKNDGTCLVRKELRPDPERIEATDKFIANPKKLDKEILARDSLLKWLDGRFC